VTLLGLVKTMGSAHDRSLPPYPPLTHAPGAS
jgi:hypothetical protein